MLGLDEKEPDETIELIVGDTSYKVKIKILRYCAFIQKIIESDKTVKVIQLELFNVHHKKYAIQKTLEYLDYHDTNPISIVTKPLKDTLVESNVSEWDSTFVEETKENILDLIYVSNYLECTPLLELVSAKLAMLIKDIILGKNTVIDAAEEIRVKFNIPGVFNPDAIKQFQGMRNGNARGMRKRHTRGIRNRHTRGIRNRHTRGMRKRNTRAIRKP
jgi:hypothetical protein